MKWFKNKIKNNFVEDIFLFLMAKAWVSIAQEVPRAGHRTRDLSSREVTLETPMWSQILQKVCELEPTLNTESLNKKNGKCHSMQIWTR